MILSKQPSEMSSAMVRAGRQALRRDLYARRAAALRDDPAITVKLNAAIASWLEEHDFETVAFYRPFRHEPDITPALLEWTRGAQHRILAVPVVEDTQNAIMHFSVFEAGDVRYGAYGIEEPAHDSAVVPDVIFAPCVGVTAQGYRLGNGGGFYDRYLAKSCASSKKIVTVAVGLEVLRLEYFTALEHDVAFDFVATESGVKIRTF